MPKPLRIQPGEKHNHLTIVEFAGYRVGPTGKKRAMVSCICDCGSIKETALSTLQSGRVKSCGDLSKHPLPPKSRKQARDFPVGEVFGLLTTVRFANHSTTPSGQKVPMMECVCECKTMSIASLWDLRSGKTKSCGSRKHSEYEDRSEPAFNMYYAHTYRSNAIRRGLAFELSKEDFRRLTQQSCFYCGAPPVARHRVTGLQTSTCTVSGVDRVDNSVGYVVGNVVPCCSRCNHAKHTMSQSDFIALAHRITALHPTA